MSLTRLPLLLVFTTFVGMGFGLTSMLPGCSVFESSKNENSGEEKQQEPPKQTVQQSQDAPKYGSPKTEKLNPTSETSSERDSLAQPVVREDKPSESGELIPASGTSPRAGHSTHPTAPEDGLPEQGRVNPTPESFPRTGGHSSGPTTPGKQLEQDAEGWIKQLIEKGQEAQSLFWGLVGVTLLLLLVVAFLFIHSRRSRQNFIRAKEIASQLDHSVGELQDRVQALETAQRAQLGAVLDFSGPASRKEAQREKESGIDTWSA